MDRPVQVMFDPNDRRRARRRAAELGITMAEYVRRLVRADLEARTPDPDAPAIIPVDGSDSGVTHHNRTIGEAVAARFAKTDEPTR